MAKAQEHARRHTHINSCKAVASTAQRRLPPLNHLLGALAPLTSAEYTSRGRQQAPSTCVGARFTTVHTAMEARKRGRALRRILHALQGGGALFSAALLACVAFLIADHRPFGLKKCARVPAASGLRFTFVTL